MKKIILSLIILTAAAIAAPTQTAAQCSAVNSSFKSGETLMYDLYFNWKFVWIKVGKASMNTTKSVYDGEQCFRTYLITRGSSQADRFFVMRDTLTSYIGLDLTPKYHSKRAEEGKHYYRDDVWYSYPNGQCEVKMRHQKNNGKSHYKTIKSAQCAYDMISMMMRARSFDATNFEEGHRILFRLADGKNCEEQAIVYRGKKKFKMENSNTTYRCLVFSFMEKENGKEEEIVTFYITDDKNHLPVRLDMNLNFGTAKAFLTGARGLRNPQDAKLK